MAGCDGRTGRRSRRDPQKTQYTRTDGSAGGLLAIHKGSLDEFSAWATGLIPGDGDHIKAHFRQWLALLGQIPASRLDDPTTLAPIDGRQRSAPLKGRRRAHLNEAERLSFPRHDVDLPDRISYVPLFNQVACRRQPLHRQLLAAAAKRRSPVYRCLVNLAHPNGMKDRVQSSWTPRLV